MFLKPRFNIVKGVCLEYKTIFLLVALAIIAIGFVLLLPPSDSSIPGNNTNTVPQTGSLIVMNEGERVSLDSGQHAARNFTVQTGWYSVSLSGGFHSQGNVAVAVLTKSLYSSFLQNSSKMSLSTFFYSNSSAPVMNKVMLSKGDWILVIYNPASVAQTVTAVTNVTLSYLSYSK
jgi:hypothetical protein